MVAKVYLSSDASAPTLNNAPGSLITLLDACLVNGYGSKPAAGWTKPFSGTNTAAYRMSTVAPASGGYINVNDSTGNFAKLNGFKTMSGIDTGTMRFPTVAQELLGSFVYCAKSTSSVNRPWILIAESRAFYLIIYNNDTNFPLLGSFYANSIFFGDYITRSANSEFEFALIGSDSQSYESGSFASVRSTSGRWMCSDYLKLLPSQRFSNDRLYYLNWTSSYFGTTTTDKMPNLVENLLEFAEIAIIESTTGSPIRGFMPGVYEPIDPWNYNTNLTVLPVTLENPNTLMYIRIVNGALLFNLSQDWY